MIGSLVLAAATSVLTIVSGTPQRDHATVAIGGTQPWIAHFRVPLVVRAPASVAKIRYTCVTRGCVIPPLDATDAPDGTERPDDADAKNGHPANAFTATVRHRQASFTFVSVLVDHFGVLDVVATPEDDTKKPHDPGVHFHLTVY